MLSADRNVSVLQPTAHTSCFDWHLVLICRKWPGHRTHNMSEWPCSRRAPGVTDWVMHARVVHNCGSMHSMHGTEKVFVSRGRIDFLFNKKRKCPNNPEQEAVAATSMHKMH